MGPRTGTSRSARSPGDALTSVRIPSQTIGLPRSSSQWYEIFNSRHTAVPAFSTTTCARVSAPARTGSSSCASHRTASGPAGRGWSPKARTSLRPVDPLLVRACRREPVERTPVWFMRQAGRSLPEYRELRKRHGLFDIVAEPELCAEVTLQPVRRHDVDAAVMFTDIMFPVLPMGVDVELVENVGPVVENPVRSAADVDRLRVTDPEESVPTILEAVRLVRSALRDDQAVIGFCGGPFTVAGYLVEGRPCREFLVVKAMMYREPATWHALMEKLTEEFAAYVRAKVRAGADVIQRFDSWVGERSP